MPNTLVHWGVQGVVSKVLFRSPDWKWVALGLTLPDLPWIAQRALRFLPLALDPYDVKLYGVVQSSFAFCLLLAAALALFSAFFWRAWAVLAVNSGLHLLLDALEQKGGNGVFFLAPLNWRMTTWDLLPPEGGILLLLTGLGLGVAFGVVWRVGGKREVRRWPPSAARRTVAVALLATYLFLPAALQQNPLAADAFSIRTLRDVAQRSGRRAAFDRAVFLPQDGGRLRIFTGEILRVEGIPLTRVRQVTAKGVLLEPDLFRADEWTAHTPWLRDGATGVGLAFVLVLWLYPFVGRKGRREQEFPSWKRA